MKTVLIHFQLILLPNPNQTIKFNALICFKKYICNYSIKFNINNNKHS